MKKLILTALVALLAAPCFAQSENAVYYSSNGKFSVDIFEHIGFGRHFVNTDDFTPSFPCELFMNLAKFNLNPTEKLGLELGVDMQFSTFTSKDTAFAQVNRLILPVSFSALDLGSYDKKRGSFTVFSLNAPVLIKGMFGDFVIGAGAVASWNITGDTYATLRQGNRKVNYQESNGKVNPFSYAFLATVSYDELGIYAKYNPEASRLMPEGSIDMSFFTLGVVFGF